MSQAIGEWIQVIPAWPSGVKLGNPLPCWRGFYLRGNTVGGYEGLENNSVMM